MAQCFQDTNFNSSSCLCQTFTTYLVLPILYSAMFLLGLSGNALSLWVFMAKISTKTTTHIYLINLGISNLILCVTMPFNAVYYSLSNSWPASSLKCQLAINVLTPVLHTNIIGGMFILTWLALSRFATLIQLNSGHRPSRCTKVLPSAFLNRMQKTSFALAMCAVTWTLVVLAVIPTVVVYATIETDRMDNDSEQACYSVPVEVGGSVSQAIAITGITMFFLCLVLVLSAYIAVIRHINRAKMKRVILDTQRVYSRVCRNISVIQIILVICLLPHHTYKSIFIAMAQHNSAWSGNLLEKCHPFSMHVEVKNLLLCLAVLRCSTDPFIYFLLDKTFKRYACGMLREGTQGSQESRTMNECGQLNHCDNNHLKGALAHKALSYSKDFKTEQTSHLDFDHKVK